MCCEAGGGRGRGQVTTQLRFQEEEEQEAMKTDEGEEFYCEFSFCRLFFLMQRSNRLPVPPPSLLQVSHDFAVNFNEENPECAGRFFDFLSLKIKNRQKNHSNI